MTIGEMQAVLPKITALFSFSTFLPHLMLYSEVVGEARRVYWCVLSLFLASQGFLDWRLHRVQSYLFCVSTFCIYHGKYFLHCEKVAGVVTLNKLLGLSQEFWATVTELVQAGKGHCGVIPPQTQRDGASTFAQGLGGELAAASMGLRECSCFMGRKRHKTAFVLVAERNQVLHLWMQCGVVASSVSYTL